MSLPSEAKRSYPARSQFAANLDYAQYAAVRDAQRGHWRQELRLQAEQQAQRRKQEKSRKLLDDQRDYERVVRELQQLKERDHQELLRANGQLIPTQPARNPAPAQPEPDWPREKPKLTPFAYAEFQKEHQRWQAQRQLTGQHKTIQALIDQLEFF